MPQMDLESLVSVCNGGASTDCKIACETLVATDDPPPETAADFPPESFSLSKDAEQDWLDRNAFFERKDSAKGNTHSTNLNPNSNPSPNPDSQRFSLNFLSKASILGLPKQFVDTNNRKKSRPAINARLFPKRTGSSLKSDSSMAEPSSPKVSCMGRVRSKKDRKRTAKESQQASDKTGEKRKTGFLASFRAIFRSGCRDQSAARTGGERRDAPPKKSKAEKKSDNAHDILARLPAGEADAPRRSLTEGEAPGLGGMKRFASGRKSDSWLDADVARS